MLFEEILQKLTLQLSAKRLKHSLGVSQTAEVLTQRFGADTNKAKIAGILHDCAKEMKSRDLLAMANSAGIVIDFIEKEVPVLLHAKMGAHLAKVEYGILDEDILQAICLHTVGGPEMTTLDKIIYLADFIEPNRSFSGVEKLRKIVEKATLDEALLAAYDQSIAFVIDTGGLLHPATVSGRNRLLIKKLKV